MASTDPGATTPRGSSLVSTIASALALAGGVIMLAAASLVTISVLMRWATSNSVPGDFEWVQLAVALAAFSYLPICQLKRGHIYVDTFTTRLPVRVNRWLDGLWDLVYALFCGLIAWRLGVGALETISNKTTTMVLGLPIGWAMLAAAIMSTFVAIVALLTMRGRGEQP